MHEDGIEDLQDLDLCADEVALDLAQKLDAPSISRSRRGEQAVQFAVLICLKRLRAESSQSTEQAIRTFSEHRCDQITRTPQMYDCSSQEDRIVQILELGCEFQAT
ncbi:hypothetical protein ADL19_05565 [Streptomyces purpurogeneiscleroticus]|nr:hypothetical protein ADL19_05565 [Streptomyces purpurogeneiscleroticus]